MAVLDCPTSFAAYMTGELRSKRARAADCANRRTDRRGRGARRNCVADGDGRPQAVRRIGCAVTRRHEPRGRPCSSDRATSGIGRQPSSPDGYPSGGARRVTRDVGARASRIGVVHFCSATEAVSQTFARVRQRGRSRWVSRSQGRGGLGGGETDRPDRVFPAPFQAPAVAIWWLWSFSRLWVAVISRHSDLAAALPRRWKRSIRRLNFVCPNTGSIIAWRFR